MTKRGRLKGLLPPRRPRTDSRYGLHILDSTEQEIREGSAADSWRSIVPTGSPGWQHSNSPLIQKCLILIEKGMRGMELDDIQAQLLEGLSPDLAKLADMAGLTERETDVLALAGNGWKQREIAGWLDIDQATVSRRLHSGRGKLATRLPDAVALELNSAVQSA